uniref:Uncharacterized protein n=1 Tax=Lactuca sativa TaxID=4236 RepID=A0A9R1X0Z8_LACSA|nr:hypothetical protein LSAT_V11C700345780 [Lactuca sativa]
MISKDLFVTILSPGTTVVAVLKAIENIFIDSKPARALYLHQKFAKETRESLHNPPVTALTASITALATNIASTTTSDQRDNGPYSQSQQPRSPGPGHSDGSYRGRGRGGWGRGRGRGHEFNALIDNNNTWDLVPRLPNMNIIGYMWIFKHKTKADGSLKRYKTCLVCDGRDNLVSWSSKRQTTISRSSTEAEYRGVANVVARICWLCNLLLEIGMPPKRTSLVYCDNGLNQHLVSKQVEAGLRVGVKKGGAALGCRVENGKEEAKKDAAAETCSILARISKQEEIQRKKEEIRKNEDCDLQPVGCCFLEKERNTERRIKPGWFSVVVCSGFCSGVNGSQGC